MAQATHVIATNGSLGEFPPRTTVLARAKRGQRLICRSRLHLVVTDLLLLALAACESVRHGSLFRGSSSSKQVLLLHLLNLLLELVGRHFLGRHSAQSFGRNLARNDVASQTGVLWVLEVDVQRSHLGAVVAAGAILHLVHLILNGLGAGEHLIGVRSHADSQRSVGYIDAPVSHLVRVDFCRHTVLGRGSLARRRRIRSGVTRRRRAGLDRSALLLGLLLALYLLGRVSLLGRHRVLPRLDHLLDQVRDPAVAGGSQLVDGNTQLGLSQQLLRRLHLLVQHLQNVVYRLAAGLFQVSHQLFDFRNTESHDGSDVMMTLQR